MKWNVNHVECIQTIQHNGLDFDVDVFPQKNIIYTLADALEHEDYPGEIMLQLTETGPGIVWNSAFFRPLNRDIIGECLETGGRVDVEIQEVEPA